MAAVGTAGARAGPGGCWLLALVMTGWVLPATARADVVRRALLISHADGGKGLQKLRYADRDVAKVKDTLVDLGGFLPGDVDVAKDEDSPGVLRRLAVIEERIRSDKAAGRETLLLVYYSGHSKDGFLRLGATRLDLDLLRGLLQDSGADVRIAVLDSCGAGELTREKGGSRAPPLVVSVDDALTARGQVIIASSSETEASQESDEIQGSFFTHYWVSGLRGDADRSGDGRVTLEEAYAYAYERTVSATLHTRAGIQHPTYRYNLRGAGDVVLANLRGISSGVTLPEELAGRFVVFDMERQRVVAEVDKARGKSLRIAVKGGTYAIKKRESDHLLMQRVKVGGDDEVEVDPARMEKISFDRDYAKGPIVELESAGPGHGLFGFSFSGGVGAQAFYDLQLTTGSGGSTTAIPDNKLPEPFNRLLTRPTFPATPIATIQLRYHGLFNRHFLLGADVNFGLLNYKLLVTNGGEVIPFHARFFMADLGFAPMFEQEIWWFRVAVGPRISTLFTWRYILSDAPVHHQFYLNLAPGVAGYAGVDILRFLHLELGFRGNLSVFAIDGFKAIGYGSVTLAAHADL
ncbi:MAG: caspase family protein [Deltaproteobacteria bacterium]|nr:caspase family protein [Deltaproteobacteria bacterium]